PLRIEVGTLDRDLIEKLREIRRRQPREYVGPLLDRRDALDRRRGQRCAMKDAMALRSRADDRHHDRDRGGDENGDGGEKKNSLFTKRHLEPACRSRWLAARA